MKELAQEIISLTNSNSIIEYKELPKDDPKQREPDITHANRLLNWKPEVERQLGLEITVSHFQRTLS
jgi:dTDP-glucose 4,6-dehydratase